MPSRPLLCLSLLLTSLVLTSAQSTPAPPDSTKLEVLSTQKPDYPLEARERQIQGEVRVMVTVNESGKVDSAEVVSGDPVLRDAAIRAAKKWTFKPFIKNGAPQRVRAPLTFDFAFGDKVLDTKIKDEKTAPAGSGSGAVPVPGSVIQGKLVHRVTPVYPEEAKRKHIEGVIILAAQISKDGRIENLSPVSGPKELIPAAIGAVQQWRYQPYFMNGEPVAVHTTITVNFVLSRR